MALNSRQSMNFRLTYGFTIFVLAACAVRIGIYLGSIGFPEYMSVIGCGIVAAIIGFLIKRAILRFSTRLE